MPRPGFCTVPIFVVRSQKSAALSQARFLGQYSTFALWSLRSALLSRNSWLTPRPNFWDRTTFLHSGASEVRYCSKIQILSLYSCSKQDAAMRQMSCSIMLSIRAFSDMETGATHFEHGAWDVGFIITCLPMTSDK